MLWISSGPRLHSKIKIVVTIACRTVDGPKGTPLYTFEGDVMCDAIDSSYFTKLIASTTSVEKSRSLQPYAKSLPRRNVSLYSVVDKLLFLLRLRLNTVPLHHVLGSFSLRWKPSRQRLRWGNDLFVDWMECSNIYSDFDCFCHQACIKERKM